MESIIKNPYDGIRVVAESGTTSDTIANKLGILKSAYDNMTDSQKRVCFLRRGNAVYHTCQDGKFIGVLPYPTSVDTATYDIINQTYVIYSVKQNQMVITDNSSDVTTANLQLCFQN